MDLRTNWRQGRARFRLWITRGGAEASVYDQEQLLVADTLVAAEFQAPRASDLGAAELRLSKALIAADAQIAARRQGRQLGVISPMTSVARRGWSLLPGATESH